ncbi:MAG: hypothetical protein IJV37_01380 [Bacteroidales bacterium]|nr:hypothetical protein [Bacteroidales bacterium]
MKELLRLPILLLPALAVTAGCTQDREQDRMHASYAEGLRRLEAREYPQAHIAFLQAYAWAQAKPDSLYMGLIQQKESIIFGRTGNYRAELEAGRQAYAIFQALDLPAKQCTAALTLAQACYDNMKWHTGDSLCASVYSRPGATDSLSIQAMLLQADFLLERPVPDFRQARSLYEQILLVDRNRLSAESFYRYALCLVSTGDSRKAEPLLQELGNLSFDNSERDYLKARIAQAQGRKEDAIRSLALAYSSRKFLMQSQLQSDVFKAQSDFYLQREALERQRSQILRLRNWLLVSVLLLTLGLCTLLFILYRNRQQERTERLISAAQESRLMMEEAERGADSYRKLFASQYRAQFAEIGRLAEPFISESRIGDFKVRAGKAYSERLDAILREIKDTRSRDFEQRLDRDLDHIVSRLRSQLPQLREQDIRFLCYLIAGFDTSTIAFLTDMSKGNVRVRKHRLRSIIAGSEAPDKVFFLTLVG